MTLRRTRGTGGRAERKARGEQACEGGKVRRREIGPYVRAESIGASKFPVRSFVREVVPSDAAGSSSAYFCEERSWAGVILNVWEGVGEGTILRTGGKACRRRCMETICRFLGRRACAGRSAAFLMEECGRMWTRVRKV